MTLQRQQQKDCKFENNLGSRPAWVTEQDLVLIPQQSEAESGTQLLTDTISMH